MYLAALAAEARTICRFVNAKEELMNIQLVIAIAGSIVALTACGGTAGGREITGSFTPDFPPSANRIDRALSTQMLQFQPDHEVILTDQRGTRTWSYAVSGRKLLLKHADGSIIKDYTLGNNGCLVYREGDYSLELTYCGGRF